MPAELMERSDPMARHLQAALDEATDEDVKYHLREALQLRIAEDHGVQVGH